MKRIFAITFILFIISYSQLVQAQESLDSAMDTLNSISLAGKTNIQILDEIQSEGTLDEYVPKRTIFGPEGRKTVFVFDLGENHELMFQQIIEYFQEEEEGYEFIGDKKKGEVMGTELKKGDITLLFAKKGNILVEYKLEQTLLSAKPVTGILSEPWIKILAVLIVLAIIGLFLYMRKKKGK